MTDVAAPTASKKFRAYLLADTTWTALLAYALASGASEAVVGLLIGARVTVQGGYIGAQAWLDRAIRAPVGGPVVFAGRRGGHGDDDFAGALRATEALVEVEEGVRR